jgi:hypothetical protein
MAGKICDYALLTLVCPKNHEIVGDEVVWRNVDLCCPKNKMDSITFRGPHKFCLNLSGSKFYLNFFYLDSTDIVKDEIAKVCIAVDDDCDGSKYPRKPQIAYTSKTSDMIRHSRA